MTSRIGPNGAIVRPSALPRNRNIPRAAASRVIDLTDDSPEATGTERVPRRALPSIESMPIGNFLKKHPNLPSTAPQNHASPSYAVSAHHHIPYLGDSSDFVGVYSTLDEAKRAAQMRYRREQKDADGWEYTWMQHDRIAELWLKAKREEGEADTESLTVTIEKIQVTVNDSRAERPPQPQRMREQWAYALRVDQTVDGEHRSTEILDIYTDLVAANRAIRQVYGELCEEILQEEPDFDSGKYAEDGTLSFYVEAIFEEVESWTFGLERKRLR